MKRFTWQIRLGLVLIIVSLIVYLIHYAIFRDAYHIFIYGIGDIAFVFVEVLLVTLIIHELLSLRAKRAIMEKLNMVIGAFFSEVGTRLLKSFSDLDPDSEALREHFVAADDWSQRELSAVRNRLKDYGYTLEPKQENYEELQSFLVARRNFMLRLLENPNLLEHESFADLLWAVFHLTEELAYREDVGDLPASDYAHLTADMQRVYGLLTSEWLAYMKHLRDNYPYLFSLAMRTNPFDPDATAVVASTIY
jgi:hypothetical protein